MVIKNAKVLGQDFKFIDADIKFGEKILDIAENLCGDEVINADGCTSFLSDGVRNLVSIGIPLGDAVKTASWNPARAVRREQEIGSLKVGKFADILVLDKSLDIVKVFVGGKEIV